MSRSKFEPISMPDARSFAFMLGQLEISDLSTAFVALVFVGSFAVVSLQTGESIKPPKND